MINAAAQFTLAPAAARQSLDPGLLKTTSRSADKIL
jgi:hypothetical protein